MRVAASIVEHVGSKRPEFMLVSVVRFEFAIYSPYAPVCELIPFVGSKIAVHFHEGCESMSGEV